LAGFENAVVGLFFEILQTYRGTDRRSLAPEFIIGKSTSRGGHVQ